MFLNRFSILLLLVCVVQHCCVVMSIGTNLTALCGYYDGIGSYDFSGLRGQLLHVGDEFYNYYINMCGVANVTAACGQENAMVCAVDKRNGTSIVKASLNNPPSWTTETNEIIMRIYGEDVNPINCPDSPLMSTSIKIYCYPYALQAPQSIQVTTYECSSAIEIWHASGCRLTYDPNTYGPPSQPCWYYNDDGPSPVKIAGAAVGITLGAVIALMILGYMIRTWCCKNGCHFRGKKHSYSHDDRAASSGNFVPMNAAAALQETDGRVVV